jgi:hypothetical protein
MMKIKYQAENVPTGYANIVTYEKMRNRAGGEYLVSIGNGIHWLAVVDDFGNLIFA